MKKRGYRKALLTVAILLAATAMVAAQESNLRYFPDDTFVVVEIDLKSIATLLPPEMLEEWRAKSMDEMGVDLLSKIDSFVMGIPQTMIDGDESGFYGLLRTGVSIDELLAIVRSQGKEVETVQIGSLTAYTVVEEEGEESYIAQAGAGMLVVGMRDGLERYQSVMSGGQASATGNAMLVEAMSDAGSGGLVRIAGVFPDSMKGMMAAQMPGASSLSTFAMNINYANDFLSLRVVLGADDAAALQQMKSMMETQLPMMKPMMKQIDPSGALAEIIDNLRSEIVGNKLTVSTGMSKASIKALIERMSDMTSGMMGPN